MEADLALHQRRLNALNALFRVQTQKFVFLKEQYAESVKVLNTRLVDIYESDETSTIDVFLGSSSLQDAVDKVQYLNEIGDQDRRIANQVAAAKAEIKVQRRRKSCAGRCRARPRSSLREPRRPATSATSSSVPRTISPRRSSRSCRTSRR
jgi:hypothetical protein